MSKFKMAQPQDVIVRCGLDPGLRGTGVALMCDGKLYQLASMKFHDLMNFIKTHKGVIYSLEDVSANKPLFIKPGTEDREKVLLKRAQDVGKCKAVGILIAEKLEAVGAKFELVRPLKGMAKKCKTDKQLFNRLTGWEGQSNKDSRDAAMLLFRYIKKSS